MSSPEPLTPQQGRGPLWWEHESLRIRDGRGFRLPEVREGDFLALLPAGAYGASMASDHCLRGQVKEVVL